VSTDRIPLTVIGGYLGAGKTTLINKVLRGDHGRRIAVIVNDFGDVAIDEALLEPATGGIRALANGCVCCAAVDGLATALEDIAALQPAVEHLIIEVSGVGDPWAVAQWGRTPRFDLDGVIVMADAVTLPRWLADGYVGDTVRQQLAAADLIVLSRRDIASPEEIRVAEESVAAASTAPTLESVDVVLDMLLHPTAAGQAPSRAHAKHSSITFVPPVVERGRVTAWLDAAPLEVVRVKGFASTGETTLLVQRVGRRSEVVARPGPESLQITVIAATPTLPTSVEEWTDSLRE
jgi:G3E family GTPase